MNNDITNIGVIGSGGRRLSTALMTAIIMGEVPPHLVDVARGTIDDSEKGIDVKTTNSYTGVKSSVALSEDDLIKLAKAKQKREAKALKKEQQREAARLSRISPNKTLGECQQT